MNPQTQRNDNFPKLSKTSIEKLVNHLLTDESYVQVVGEALINLLETKENERYE
jgi:hypothetical protein